MNKIIPIILGVIFLQSCVSIQKGLVSPKVLETINLNSNNFIEVKEQTYDLTDEDFAISVWIKTNSENTQMIAQKGGSNGPDDPQYWLRLNDSHGKLTFLTGNGDHHSSYISSQTDLNDGVWHHVLARRSKNMLALFIDGNLEIEKEKELKNCSNSQSLKIGIQIFGYKRNPFKGQLNEFRLYKTDINDAQLKKLIRKTKPNTM